MRVPFVLSSHVRQQQRHRFFLASSIARRRSQIVGDDVRRMGVPVRLVTHGGPVPPTVPIDRAVRFSLAPRARRRRTRNRTFGIVLARGRDEGRRANARATREERASQSRGFHGGGDARDVPDPSRTRVVDVDDSIRCRARDGRARERRRRDGRACEVPAGRARAFQSRRRALHYNAIDIARAARLRSRLRCIVVFVFYFCVLVLCVLLDSRFRSLREER